MKPNEQHQHLIRVNGRRSVGAYGSTPQEAYRNAIKVAKETWPDNAHIFELASSHALQVAV